MRRVISDLNTRALLMEMVHFIPPSQRRLAILAAQADTAPVLIYGASGTGKGAIARWIHANGPRGAKPFVPCMRDQNLLTQLAKAQGGTLVAADIGTWPLTEQKTLLNFLATRSIPHLTSRMILNTRIIATTSHTLEGRAQAGLFNPDLLEKLNVFRLEMPPLFRRLEEFEDIALGIMREISRELHKEHLKGIDATAMMRLKDHDWPGNLREMRNVLRVAVIAAQGEQIESSDFPDFGHEKIDFHATREKFEKIYIMELLKTFNWQIDETCRMTRMDKATLLLKIKQLGIPMSGPSLLQ